MYTPWVAYVGAFNFPFGQAGSRRVHGIACSLLEAGYNVVVGSGDHAPENLTTLKQSIDNSCTLQYIGLGEIPFKQSNVLTKAYHWFIAQGSRTIKWLDEQSTKPAYVILYNAYTPYTFKLVNWCQLNNIPLINDVVEFYDPRQMNGGLFGPFNLMNKFNFHFLYTKGNGVIVISSYLEKYFLDRSCKVLRIPPTLDTDHITPNFEIRENNTNVITLAYTGTPGKKDLLDNVIEAIFRLDKKGKYIKLIIAGPNVSEILQLPVFFNHRIKKIPPFIQVLGPQSHENAISIISSAEYMPLLRPPLRYAQAGFPTKVTESLASGTPVICNITSDLAEYIHDAVEGIICRDESTDAFIEALDRISRLTPQKRVEMRHAARAQAERSFDFRVYTDSLAEFLGKIS